MLHLLTKTLRCGRALALGAAIAMPIPALAQDTPQHGGEISINVHREAPNFDPLGSTNFGLHSRIGLAMNTLVEWSYGPDIGYGEFVPRPGLAESWEISDDGLTYTFHLRDDVVWHDIAPVSGRPFVAADVVATYEAIMEGGIQRGLLDAVESISAPDDHTVILTLSRPYMPMLQNTAHHNMWVLPQEAFDGSYDRETTVIGTGPFVMVSNEPGVSTNFERNPNYFQVSDAGEQLPYLDAVQILPLVDLNARVMAFRSQQIDIWFGPLNLLQMEEIARSIPDIQQVTTVANTQTELFLNPAVEELSDLRVRQAINMAIDRVAMGRVVRGGGEIGGIVGPALASQTLPESERLEIYGSPDQDEARRLLAEAGYPDGFSLEMTVVNYGEEFVREAEWIQQDLAEIGIDVELAIMDRSTGLAQAGEGNFEALFLIMSPFTEADDYFYNHFNPEGPRNYTNIDDPELNALIMAQQAELDPDARLQGIYEVQRYVAENIMNPLPIWAAVLRHPVQPRVHGYYPMMPQGFPSLQEVYVTE